MKLIAHERKKINLFSVKKLFQIWKMISFCTGRTYKHVGVIQSAAAGDICAKATNDN